MKNSIAKLKQNNVEISISKKQKVQILGGINVMKICANDNLTGLVPNGSGSGLVARQEGF